ncbi:7442_t:CDS:2, partial [Scutellospora calospora]
NHPVTHPTNHPVTHPTNQPAAHQTNQPATHPTNQPVTHSTNQPATHSTNQPATHSTNQPATHSTNQPADNTNAHSAGGDQTSTTDPSHKIGGGNQTSTTDPSHKIGGDQTSTTDHSHKIGGGPPTDNSPHQAGKGVTPIDTKGVYTTPHVQFPSFYDFMFYTQSIIATGWLSLNLTSEYRRFTSTFSWACGQGFINFDILTSTANNLRSSICNIINVMNVPSVPGACVDQKNGYMLPPVGSDSSLIFGSTFPTNSTQSIHSPNGFDSYAQLIGVPVEDLPFISMIGFLVIIGIAITTVLLSTGIALILLKYKYKQNPPVSLENLRDNSHLILHGGVLRVVNIYAS